MNDNEYNALVDKVEAKIYKRRVLDMNDSEKMVGWFERIVMIVDKHGWLKVLSVFVFVVFVVASLMFMNAIDNQNVIERWIEKKETEHAIGKDIRQKIDPKVSEAMVKILYTMQADRVSILEMHNGKENMTSLPFVYCDMTYEKTRDSVPYISEEYENLNMSKFTFPDYLYRNKYFIGEISSIHSIDKKLALRLETNNVNYCGIVLIRTNIDIGFLMVSFLEKPKMDYNEILSCLMYYVQEIGTYLDYAKQKEG